MAFILRQPLRPLRPWLSALPRTQLRFRAFSNSVDEVAERDRSLRRSSVVNDDAHRKRLIYRSKQRGWLEVDLLLGKWATDNVPMLGSEDLVKYEAILECETLDIYNLLTGRLELAEMEEQLRARGIEQNLVFAQPVLDQLRDFCLSNPIGRADPKAYAAVKGVYSN